MEAKVKSIILEKGITKYARFLINFTCVLIGIDVFRNIQGILRLIK